MAARKKGLLLLGKKKFPILIRTKAMHTKYQKGGRHLNAKLKMQKFSLSTIIFKLSIRSSFFTFHFALQAKIRSRNEFGFSAETVLDLFQTFKDFSTRASTDLFQRIEDTYYKDEPSSTIEVPHSRKNDFFNSEPLSTKEEKGKNDQHLRAQVLHI